MVRLRRSALRWSAGRCRRATFFPWLDHEPLTPTLHAERLNRGACDDGGVFARGGDNTGKREGGEAGSWVSEGATRARGGGGGGGGESASASSGGVGRGARAGRREVARGRFAPRRAPRRARRMDKSPAPKPPKTLKPRNAGDADRALERDAAAGPRGRGSPKRAAKARRAARTLGAARANGASASAVGAVRRSNDGGRRETHPRNAGRARRSPPFIAGNAESAWLCAARGAGALRRTPTVGIAVVRADMQNIASNY